MSPTPAAVIVLSAGDGTRMRSSINKALHRIGGRPLVAHAVYAATGTGATHVSVVVRAQRDAVAAAARAAAPEVLIADQDEVYGTGRAVECALAVLPSDLQGTVLVITGDTPLLTAQTLTDVTRHHESSDAVATVVTGIVPDATGYGRIVRGADGTVQAIVEHKHATAGTTRHRRVQLRPLRLRRGSPARHDRTDRGARRGRREVPDRRRRGRRGAGAHRLGVRAARTCGRPRASTTRRSWRGSARSSTGAPSTA